MKSLLLKDYYNINHNLKSLFFMLLIFAVLLLPRSGLIPYIITCGILCSMMSITTFTFDDSCKWIKYALVMPITRKQYVAGKFIMLFLFSAFGILAGLFLGVGISLALYPMGLLKPEFFFLTAATGPEIFLELAVSSGLGLVCSVVLSGMTIPLLFKYGAEKARMLSILSILLPVLIFWLVSVLLGVLGVTLSNAGITLLICLSPAAAALWTFGMYRISCRIFIKQELNG